MYSGLYLEESYIFLASVSEVFAAGERSTSLGRCLQLCDVAFFWGPEQLSGDTWRSTERVEVRCLYSKGYKYQFRKGAVIVCVLDGPDSRLGAGGDAVALSAG